MVSVAVSEMFDAIQALRTQIMTLAGGAPQADLWKAWPDRQVELHVAPAITVQRIVQRHGGRVWVEGNVGEGAAYYFTVGAPL